MLHGKKSPKNIKKNVNMGVLTKRELDQIRSFLPKNWRQLIAESADGIKIRQITQVFNQRTKNPDDNTVVWNAINTVLQEAGQKHLVKRINQRLKFCNALYNVVQK